MSDDNESRQELEQRFLGTLANYFSVRETPTGFYNTVSVMKDELKKLNQQLAVASAASDRLANSLNKVTTYGVWVAGIGVAVAAISVGFAIYKHLAT